MRDRFAREFPAMAVRWAAEIPPDPRVLVVNEPLAARLGLDPRWLRSPDGVGLLTGTRPPDGATPVAQAYAGHQFGVFVPRLGDGRALLLGELTGTDGRLVDLHLKGSGRTPFARGGDGLAAVGPMLREYLISEALHALGIPTTRALAVVATGRPVHRDGVLPGAVLARVAASHLRVGSFQYARATGGPGLLRRLAEHAAARHHPHATTPAALYEAVVAAQARLIARWMLAGFVHGVMNTDNMTVSGETIDYGPCAFLDAFDPDTVFSSIDHGGRYRYGNQPGIAEWNLARLAEALLPLLADDEERAVERAAEILGGFRGHYERAWSDGMHAKLGLTPGADPALAAEVPALLQAGRTDHTAFFRALAGAARGDEAPARERLGDTPEAAAWLTRWRTLAPDPDAMDRVNPVYIPRNHLVEEALDAATAGDLTPLHDLLEVITAPYDERPDRARYAEPAPAVFGASYRTFCGT